MHQTISDPKKYFEQSYNINFEIYRKVNKL
jgi:hypothetical protein